MPFKIRCACGQELTAPDAAGGKKVRCPACKRTFALPAVPAARQPSRPAPTAEPIPVAPADRPAAPGTSPPGIAPRPPGSSTIRLAPTEDAATASTAAGAGLAATCPFCQAPIPPGAVICINCGLNFQTGQRIATEEERAPRQLPRRNVLLVALDVVYKPFKTVDAIGGYIQNPGFVLHMWLFVAATVAADAAARLGVSIIQQEQQHADEVATAVVGLGVLIPAMLVAAAISLLIDAAFFYGAGLIFGVGGNFLQLLLYLGFVGGVARIGNLAVLAAIVATGDVEVLIYLSIIFFIWQLVLNVAVLSRTYDLNPGLAIGVGAVAMLLKIYVGAGILTWVTGLFGA